MIGFFAAQAMSQGLWTPAHLPAPAVVRFDWDSIVSVSGAASAWINRGSAGGQLEQGTANRRPAILAGELNGRDALRFDADNDFVLQRSSDAFRSCPAAGLLVVYRKRLVDPAYAERAVVIFGRGTTPEASRVGFFSARGAANTPQFGGRNADTGAFDFVQHSGPVSGDWTIAFGENRYADRVISLSIDGATPVVKASAWASGASTSDTAGLNNIVGGHIPTGAGSPPPVGGYSDCDVSLIVGLNYAATADDQARLVGWAAHETGLAENLPDNHPFRHAPPYVNTPVLQPSFAASPAVYGFVAATDSGDIGVAAGPAVATAFGTLLDPEPTLGGGQGITTASASGTLTVRLDGIAPATTPAEAIVMDHQGGHIATVALSDGGGYYSGSASASLTNGGVYYVRVQAA